MKSKTIVNLLVPSLLTILVISVGSFSEGGRSNTNRSKGRAKAHQASSASSVAGFPTIAAKPTPQWDTNWQCPPEGDGNENNLSGGDPQLNRLKNRIDTGEFQPVDFNVVKGLPIPAGTHKHRSQWSAAQKDAIAKFEGTPISIEGFLAIVNNAKPNTPPNNQGGREEGPESCNCHKDTPTFHDYHVWLLPAAGASRQNAIVVEITPPVRASHQNWSLAALTQMAKQNQRVRISGWLLFDQEHPEQLGKTRATLWEIHPIIKIETQVNGNWTTVN